MTTKEEALVRKIEKAGIKKSLKVGHKLTKEELLELKIQVLPRIWRILIALCGFAFAVLASWCLKTGASGWGIAWAVASLLFFMFALFGVRRMIDTVLESSQDFAVDGVIRLAMDGIAAVVKAVFDKR